MHWVKQSTALPSPLSICVCVDAHCMNPWRIVVRGSSSPKAWLLGHTYLWLSSLTRPAALSTTLPLRRSSLYPSTFSYYRRQYVPFTSPFYTMSTSSKAADVPEEAPFNESTQEASKKKKAVAGAKKKAPKAESLPAAKKAKHATKKELSDDDSAESAAKKSITAKRNKSAPHQRITERDPLPKLWNPADASEGSYSKSNIIVSVIFPKRKLKDILRYSE